jgi:hypothetical protein
MHARLASLPISVTLSALLLSGGLAAADSIKVRGGTLACGGNHFSRIEGTELHRTSYIFRNFSGYATVTIKRVRVFDANGNVLFDFPGVELPASANTVLGPHQTTQINTADILFEDLDSTARPIQSHVEWSYGQRQKDVALSGSTVRTVRDSDTGTELSRADSECKLIDFRR